MSRGRGGSTRPRARRSAPTCPAGCARRWLPMATETPLATLAGLDNLELGPQQGRDLLRGSGSKALGSIWPKLLAIAIVVGIWQLVYLSGYKPAYIFPGPATVLPDLWHQMQHAQLWQAIGTT